MLGVNDVDADSSSGAVKAQEASNGAHMATIGIRMIPRFQETIIGKPTGRILLHPGKLSAYLTASTSKAVANAT